MLRSVGSDPCIVVGNGEGGDAHVGTDLCVKLAPLESEKLKYFNRYFDKLKERFGNVGIFCLSLLRAEGEEANVLHA